VKLLLDENLAPRLAGALSDLYPGSLHLRDCGLRGMSDAEVWRYAVENGFAIVSKDSEHRWLRCGESMTALESFW